MCTPRLCLLSVLLLATGLWPVHASFAAMPGEDPATNAVGSVASGAVRTYRQLAPCTDIERVYTRTSEISFALATVPDPRVPRHRRAYDLAVIAILQGMQDQGYSLDRFVLPWQGVLSGDGEGATDIPTDDEQYGVMLFRRDAWRDGTGTGGGAPSIRALYVVPETATYGVPAGTALAAIRRMLAQSGHGSMADVPPDDAAEHAGSCGDPEPSTPAPAGATQPRLAAHASCGAQERQGPYLLVSGPSFSGSVDSIAQINARLVAEGSPYLCAVSPSASAASNHRIVNGAGTRLQFHGLAVDDDAKLAALWDMALRLGAHGNSGEVAILYDTTLFGSEVCPLPRGEPTVRCDAPDLGKRGKRQCLCRHAHRTSYPSNIADVRAALQPALEQDASLMKKVALGKYLPLDHGAGNGSEFPDGRQSKLTATGAYLQLQRIIQVMGNLDAKLVIVVGTDVRDRMFLFEQLREGLPSAQLADLEADTLSNHPQYIHATRGAVLMASERIAWFTRPEGGGTNLEVGATDVQVLQRALVRGIEQGPSWRARTDLPPGCGFSRDDGPVMHVVGRKVLLPVLCPTPQERRQRLWIAPLLALGAMALLLLASPLSRRTGALAGLERLGASTAPGYHRMRRLAGGYDPAINRTTGMALLAMALMLLMALVLRDRVLGAIALLVGPAYCWAISYLAGAYDTLGGRGIPAPDRHRLRRIVQDSLLGALAIGVSLAMLLMWLGADAFGEALIVRLGFAAGAGMAICIAMMLAVLLLLLADSALAVARSASARNESVLLHALGLEQESEERARLQGMFRCGLLPRSSLLTVGMLALALCVLYALPVKLTVFGRPAAVLALLCVIAMSYVALLFLVTAIRMRQRALKVAALLRDSVLASRIAGEDGHASGLWPAPLTAGLRFASTPAVARVKDGGRGAVSLLAPSGWEAFVQALRARTAQLPAGPTQPSERDTRIAAFALLASEVSLVRWATFSGVVSCLAVAGFVYLYPVSGADAFMLFNLAVLALTGLFAGHTAMSFERNEAMSNILCNRTAKVEWSGTLFNYVAVPFAVLVLVIGITQIPGVINLGGGMFDSTLKELAFTLFGGL